MTTQRPYSGHFDDSEGAANPATPLTSMAAVSRAVHYSLVKVSLVVFLAAAIGASAGGWLLSHTGQAEVNRVERAVKMRIDQYVMEVMRLSDRVYTLEALITRRPRPKVEPVVTVSGDADIVFVGDASSDIDIRIGESNSSPPIATIDGETYAITYGTRSSGEKYTCEDALRFLAKGGK